MTMLPKVSELTPSERNSRSRFRLSPEAEGPNPEGTDEADDDEEEANAAEDEYDVWVVLMEIREGPFGLAAFRAVEPSLMIFLL